MACQLEALLLMARTQVWFPVLSMSVELRLRMWQILNYTVLVQTRSPSYSVVCLATE